MCYKPDYRGIVRGFCAPRHIRGYCDRYGTAWARVREFATPCHLEMEVTDLLPNRGLPVRGSSVQKGLLYYRHIDSHGRFGLTDDTISWEKTQIGWDTRATVRPHSSAAFLLYRPTVAAKWLPLNPSCAQSRRRHTPPEMSHMAKML